MKKRLVKKWINRYITPLIKELSTTTFRGWEIKDDGYGTEEVHSGINHSIKNGYEVPEGNIVPLGNGVRNNIIRTADVIKHIIETHDNVYVRSLPMVEGYRLIMRLITE